MKLYYLIVYVPIEHGDAIRNALAKAGAGTIGRYDSCSFSVRGVGRFRPLDGANPTVGSVGSLEEVHEERIEVVVVEGDLTKVLTAVKEAHPYEEPALHILPMEDYKEYL